MNKYFLLILLLPFSIESGEGGEKKVHDYTDISDTEQDLEEQYYNESSTPSDALGANPFAALSLVGGEDLPFIEKICLEEQEWRKKEQQEEKKWRKKAKQEKKERARAEAQIRAEQEEQERRKKEQQEEAQRRQENHQRVIVGLQQTGKHSLVTPRNHLYNRQGRSENGYFKDKKPGRSDKSKNWREEPSTGMTVLDSVKLPPELKDSETSEVVFEERKQKEATFTHLEITDKNFPTLESLTRKRELEIRVVQLSRGTLLLKTVGQFQLDE